MNSLELKNLISKTSNSFCLAKFHEASIWLYNNKIASCHHTPFHNLGSTLDSFFNTNEKRNQQKSMLEGNRPSECNYCWKLENQNLVSDRIIKTSNYPNYLDTNSYFDPNFNFKPKVLELAFSNTCNLACSYCNADFSSQWLNDIRVNGTYESLTTDKRYHYQRSIESYNHNFCDLELFWSWFDCVIAEIDIIRVTGGEPLLHEETFKLLDLAREKNPKIKIAINTNLCLKSSLMSRFKEKVSKLDHVSIYTSNESSGYTSEFLRDGLNYSNWVNNLKFLDQLNLDHIFIMTTIGAICLESFDKFLEDIIEIRQHMKTKISVEFNFLSYPEFQSIDVLSQHALTYYYNKYVKVQKQLSQKLTEDENVKFQRLISKLKISVHKDQTSLAKDFISFFNQYSLRRNKDITKLEIMKFL